MTDRPLSIDIRPPLVLKANDLVLLTREDGNIPLEVPGFGLFYRDTCYLSAYGISLHDTKPLMLMSSDSQGIAAQIELTNSALATANGRRIQNHKLSLRRALSVLEEGPTFVDVLTLRSYADYSIELPISLEFQTIFESMFVLRGAPPGKRGRLLAPVCSGSSLRFCYEGADGVRRSLLVYFSITPLVAPRTCERAVAHFELTLAPRATQELLVSMQVDERAVDAPAPVATTALGHAATVRKSVTVATARLLDDFAKIGTSNAKFGDVVARSLTDLAMLQVRRGVHSFTAAGIPWFVGLFGRDSLLPA
ncbi:MAG TPA: glycogen debranching N-terminal domain-containing protein, partial [Polyangiales bacterium]|nr:glycogen debranching N-terminal domain-containing protein [Polyangiales bacterium]